jgi:hypothetical protein
MEPRGDQFETHDPEKEQIMSAEPQDLRKEIEDLKASQAAQAATQAGAMSTLTAMNAGTVGTLAAGGVGLILGVVLGLWMGRALTRP